MPPWPEVKCNKMQVMTCESYSVCERSHWLNPRQRSLGMFDCLVGGCLNAMVWCLCVVVWSCIYFTLLPSRQSCVWCCPTANARTGEVPLITHPLLFQLVFKFLCWRGYQQWTTSPMGGKYLENAGELKKRFSFRVILQS